MSRIWAWLRGARSAVRATNWPPSWGVLIAYTTLLLGSALDAETIASIPVQWLARIGFIFVALIIVFVSRLYVVPGTAALVGLLLWATLVTIVNVRTQDFAALLPPLATSAYFVFVSARFLVILGFLASAYVVYWLLVRGYREAMIRQTVIIGTLAALVAVYVYYAQVYGLPDLPRTRMGTSGGEQATTFSYPFHRAMGTFREPSHLAEWLVVPFLLSFEDRGKRWTAFHSIIIGVALLLTGSLTGILGALLGFAGAIAATRLVAPVRWGLVFRVAVVSAAAVALFSVMAVPNEPGGANLSELFIERAVPPLLGGPSQSNRAYVYAFLAEERVPVIGYGLGHANLILSWHLRIDTIASFLSLYINILLSTGIVGLLLLVAALLHPPLRVVALRGASLSRPLLMVLAAYLAWLIMFAVSAEELPVMFGVVYALLAYAAQRRLPSAAGGEG